MRFWLQSNCADAFATDPYNSTLTGGKEAIQRERSSSIGCWSFLSVRLLLLSLWFGVALTNKVSADQLSVMDNGMEFMGQLELLIMVIYLKLVYFRI